MQVEEILDYINEIAPWNYAEEWDNVGLILGSRQNRINKVLLCMDATSSVIEEAISLGIDLIVSHHPFLYSKLDKLDFDTQKGQQIHALVKNDISVISAHTNLDVAVGGVNDTLAETLGLTGLKPLKSYIPEGLNVDPGLGKVGTLKSELPFNEFISEVKKQLDIPNLRVVGKHPDMVRTVAVFCGSFDVDLNYLKTVKHDVLVTGDLKYHTSLDAREMGLCLVDVGHFASERIILSRLGQKIKDRFNSVEVVYSKVEEDPFIFA